MAGPGLCQACPMTRQGSLAVPMYGMHWATYGPYSSQEPQRNGADAACAPDDSAAFEAWLNQELPEELSDEDLLL